MADAILIGIDLGSNAFRMHVLRCASASFELIFSYRCPVAIGAGVMNTGELSLERMRYAESVLSHFSGLLLHYVPDDVQVYATSAVRYAANRHVFIQTAADILGYPITLLSGQDEAALIYRGTLYAYPDPLLLRLVMDIGGGSTECILGRGEHILVWESLAVGCLSLCDVFFPEAKLTPSAITEAGHYVRRLLSQSVSCQRMSDMGHERALGCSGSVRVLLQLLPPRSVPCICLEEIHTLLQRLSQYSSLHEIRLPELTTEQAYLLLPCLIILTELCIYLSVERLFFSSMDMVVGGLLAGRSLLVHPDFRHAGWLALAKRVGDVHRGELLYKQFSALWSAMLGQPCSSEALRVCYAYPLGASCGWQHRQLSRSHMISYADISGASPEDRQRVLSFLAQIDADSVQDLDIYSEEEWMIVCLMRLAVVAVRYSNGQFVTMVSADSCHCLCYIPAMPTQDLVYEAYQKEVLAWAQRGYQLSVLLLT